MKLKKSIAIALSLSLLITGLTACGKKADNTAGDNVTAKDNVTLTLGVVGSVYEEIWAPAKEQLAKEGIDLKIQQFSDYVTPNNALANGEIDLNSFQHQIYLDTEIENNDYKIQSIGYSFIIPLNLYSNKVKSLSEIKDGDTIAIPNDLTNGGRALKVLEAANLIKLKDDAAFSPTIDDIDKTY